MAKVGGFFIQVPEPEIWKAELFELGRKMEVVPIAWRKDYDQTSGTVLVALKNPDEIFGYATSFPSGHTTESTAIFLTAATVIATLETQTNTKILAYVVALLAIVVVGFSRLYPGMHWPTDFLGGWFLGSAWSLAAWVALRR